MIKYFRSRGFMDKMFVLAFLFVTVNVAITYLLVALSGVLGITDISPVNEIIIGSFAFLSIFAGFMVWKAKVENCRKHKDVNRLEELESEESA